MRPKEIDANDDLDDDLLPEDDVEIAPDSQPHQPTNLELELQNAPRRKQRFILQKALKIRNMETEGRPRKPVRASLDYGSNFELSDLVE